MIQTVKLNTIEEIQRLNRVASNEDYDTFVHCESIMIDAKSLLALFALLGRQVAVVVPDEVCPKYFAKMMKRMKLTVV